MDEFGGDDFIEPIGLGCSLERFAEWKEILDIVTSLKEKPANQTNSAEKAFERFRYIIDQYKEQPHLLDTHLEEILNEIVFIVQNDDIPEFNKHQAFKYMRLITNARGIKAILQHLPHFASDLEPVLSLLERQDEKDSLLWETRYCLLLWLSIIVKIPFHMSRLDTDDVPENCTIIQRLFNICKKYSMVGDLCRNACAYLTSQFLTRTDTKEDLLPEYLDWATEIITKENFEWLRFGPMLSLSAILKYGKREDLLPHAPKLLKTMMAMKWRSEPYRLSRKFAMKIIQRIGLTFLKARVISWRYQRGMRILPANKADWPTGDQNTGLGPKEVEEEEKEDDMNFEVPPEMEDIIEELIQGLRDPDITVRWSAAKGIGRIMGRMSRQLGDDVVGYVLDLLNPREADSAWHGGCLALAELSKRGLLLPSRLPEVIPLLRKALLYDEPQGHISTGQPIRDAACYLAWTFARAYDSGVFAPFVPEVANALVVLMCYDREVIIRRAASAAFQEHIGRQGTFPHGIEILTAADYFTVGVRNNAYLNISVYIAQFKEYTTSLIDHLVDRKIEHWDIAIRDLAAKALHNLTAHAEEYMVEVVLPTLIQKTGSIDINVRHGSIVAIGEVVYALSLTHKELPLGKEVTREIEEIVRGKRKKQIFRGISGELMKLACCQLIERCSLAKFVPSDDLVIGDWQELLDECLCHEVGNIRSHAAAALFTLSSEYYVSEGRPDTSRTAVIIDNYIGKLKAGDETTRLGHALALGSLPWEALIGKVDVVVDSLVECATLTDSTEKWVQSRKQALLSLNSICCKVGIRSQGTEKTSCEKHLLKIISCMVEGLLDYTMDDSGDTGAWVREAAMSALQSVMELAAKEAPHLLTENIVERAITRIAQQAVERIDRTRSLAGGIFSSLLHSDPRVPHIPQREELVKIFPEEACKNEINWLSAVETFPKFTQMLSLESYTHSILLGLIISVGGITESLVTASSNCLFDYLRVQDVSELHRLCNLIAFIYETNLQNDRIILPLLNFLEKLFGSGTIEPVLKDPSSKFALQIFNLTRTALTGKNDRHKLHQSIDVYCQLIQCGCVDHPIDAKIVRCQA